ncbi:hypothetical protein THAOC_05552 [Thalassiosira oceanica]|uniref:Uncharacterized protein n=1 Tax=Thalassiosira oceanica TaxID=159749 RepID=K0T706_THAOC|nr:hypothetical protein THAOC_05552 [Thalassiosira oceanica]|eukprot:EJK72874.1 hypothetical protein THAOC_05552 [Thalassiosira oceanica]
MPGWEVASFGRLHARRGSKGRQALCAYGGDNELGRREAVAYGGAYGGAYYDRRACNAFKHSGAYAGRWPYGAFAYDARANTNNFRANARIKILLAALLAKSTEAKFREGASVVRG